MSGSRQNIILVSVDSLRADHCGFLGDDRGLTPTMDGLAADGVSFETAVAPGPQTFSSMPAVFTGRPRPPESLEKYPGATHWERRLAAIDDHLDRYAPLPERLGELGYSTVGFSPNPWTSTASGFDRGFDRFEDFSGAESEGRLRRLVDRTPGVDTDSKPVELVLDMLTGSSFFSRWESFYEEVDAAREELSEPYFLWVFLLDTHYPFLPPRTDRDEQSLVGMYASAVRSEKAMRGGAETMPASVRQSLRRSYRDTVRSVDAFVERLRTDSAGDDPALFVHADHGESFGEHGNYGHHHRQLYQENVHVPYLVHNAGSDATVAEPTSLATIPTAALAVARGDPVDPSTVTARSAVATSECGTNRAVRERRFKFIDSTDREALFDIETDPRERTDVSGRHRTPYRRTRSRLERFTNHCDEVDRLSRAARTMAARVDL
jgi:arylsulfatase